MAASTPADKMSPSMSRTIWSDIFGIESRFGTPCAYELRLTFGREPKLVRVLSHHDREKTVDPGHVGCSPEETEARGQSIPGWKGVRVRRHLHRKSMIQRQTRTSRLANVA